MSEERVVVVGAGLSGLRTIEHLRQYGFKGSLTLVGGENHLPYDRPPLSKQVLRGERNLPSLREEYDSLEVNAILGRRAIAVDTDTSIVTLDDGTIVAYDVAVLAPGAMPRWLPGVTPRAGIHVLRTIEDSLAVRSAIRAGRPLAVVGGGFVGCEVAASAREMNAKVTLIEASAAPLVRVIGPLAASEIVKLHESRGVEVLSGDGVSTLLGNDQVEGVLLSSGRRVDASEVVLGLGVLPDVGWLAESDIEIDDGIICSAAGQTSVANVYAVGDAARWYHPLLADHRRVEHWTNAADQADVVAQNIAARNTQALLEEVPYFWSDQYDVKVQALGFIDGIHDSVVLHPGGRTVVVYSSNGILTGVLGFSATRSVLRMRALIAAAAPVHHATDQLMS